MIFFLQRTPSISEIEVEKADVWIKRSFKKWYNKGQALGDLNFWPWCTNRDRVCPHTLKTTYVCVSHSVMSSSLQPCGLLPIRLLCPCDFLGKNTGGGCHFLLQGIFPTQGSIHVSCIGRRILHHWATWEAKSLISTVLLMASHFSIALRIPWTVWKGKKIWHWKMNSPGQ